MTSNYSISFSKCCQFTMAIYSSLVLTINSIYIFIFHNIYSPKSFSSNIIEFVHVHVYLTLINLEELKLCFVFLFFSLQKVHRWR